MKKLIQQILKFGVVGFLCFFIDYGIMVALTELCGISSVISSGISFSVSVIVNYILSITVVFDADKEANKAKQFVIFLILSIIWPWYQSGNYVGRNLLAGSVYGTLLHAG